MSQPSTKSTTPKSSSAIVSPKSLDICLLSYRGNPYSGGQGVYIKYLSRALTQLGHSVDVIAGEPYPDVDSTVRLIKLPGENIFEADSRIRAFDPAYIRSPTKLFEWASVITGGFPEPYTFGKRVVEYFSEKKPQYDIVHDNQSLCYGLLELAEMGIPLIATIHHPITVDREYDLAHADSITRRLFIRRWYRFLSMQEQVVKNLQHIITVSEAAKQRTISDFNASPDVIEVIYNGIDTTQFVPRAEPITIPKQLIATVSSGLSLKGTKYLLEAFSVINNTDSETELHLIGSLDEQALSLARKLNIIDNITTYSQISYNYMVDLYAQSSVAVVPSLYEGFGLPAGEAMACGVPVVATTGGGLPEVVGDAGMLVSPGDATALADGVLKLLEDDTFRHRLGRQARQRITAEFNWESTASRTVDCYREAIQHAHN